jgi:uncharacterized protein
MTSDDNTNVPQMPANGLKQTPWWKYRMLWLVIGGPATVVVASLVTGYIAMRGQDPVLMREEVPDTAATAKGAAESMTPALQARNHAATAKP